MRNDKIAVKGHVRCHGTKLLLLHLLQLLASEAPIINIMLSNSGIIAP